MPSALRPIPEFLWRSLYRLLRPRTATVLRRPGARTVTALLRPRRRVATDLLRLLLRTALVRRRLLRTVTDRRPRRVGRTATTVSGLSPHCGF